MGTSGTPARAVLVALLDTAVALVLATVCALVALALGGGDVAAPSEDPFARVLAWELDAADGARAEEVLGAARAAAEEDAGRTHVELVDRGGTRWIVASFQGDPAASDVADAVTRSGAWTGKLEVGQRWSLELERLVEDPAVVLGWVEHTDALALVATPLVFLACGLWFRRRRRVVGWERPLGAPGATVGLRVFQGIAIGIAGTVLAMSLELGLRTLGVPQTEQEWLLHLAGGGGPGAVVLVVLAVVLAPLGEELFFRGHLFRFLHARASRRAAYVVSTVVFAAAHLHPALLPSYVLLGALLAWSYERSRSLVVPLTAHAVVNAIGVGILLVTAP